MSNTEKNEKYEKTLAHVNPYSTPSKLKITDIRFTDIVGAPMHCTLIKVYTNQGLVGYGEVRDGSDKTYALMLKSRLLGENPCRIDKLFKRIKQFGSHGRQGGGVSGLEIALWDLAGKAYGIPVYQMLGGKYRDKVRMYCDTHGNENMSVGEALKERMEQGYTFLKMDLGIEEIMHEPSTISAPIGFLEGYKEKMKKYANVPGQSGFSDEELRAHKSQWYDTFSLAHPFTGIHITEKGLDLLEQKVADVRSIIGYEVPLATDHFGHIGIDDCIKLAKRLEKYNLAWVEDMVPWTYTEQYVRLSESIHIPVCTGEDIYLKENFYPLLASGGISIIHPDILSAGGIMELKKIGDLAQDHGVAMAVHMAATPVACIAAVHSIAATENFLALEFHSSDVPWWDDLVQGLPKPIVQNGFIQVPEGPGLGIESLNEELLAKHLHPSFPVLWEETDQWNHYLSNDRIWS